MEIVPVRHKLSPFVLILTISACGCRPESVLPEFIFPFISRNLVFFQNSLLRLSQGPNIYYMWV